MTDTTPEIGIRTILVPIDVSVDRQRDKIFALARATGRQHGASLHFLTVVPEMYLATTTDPKSLIEKATEHAERLLRREIAAHVPDEANVKSHVIYGSVSGKIIDVAHSIEADLIIIHARQNKTFRYPMGSVASRVAGHAPCSVHVVRE